MALTELANRFNRYIVECKGVVMRFIITIPDDLIDTLWNVKYFNMMYQPPAQRRFNRYIVECKVNIRRSEYRKRNAI